MNEILAHGAYVCARVDDRSALRGAGAAITALAKRLGLRHEFEPGDPSIRESYALLRRVDAIPRDVADDGVLHADAIVHAVSTQAGRIDEVCEALEKLLAPAARVRTLRGVVRPRIYTGAAMNEFAYAHQVTQQPGPAAPHAFLTPLNKTAAWWKKGWMERHTYFLPRYDDAGKMVSEGHALATEAGIAHLYRRTYKALTEPVEGDQYDFVSYFECADGGVPFFHQVCDALRDTTRNPEWTFVREGPTWHGRRVGTWEELF
jgi:hypothetical protein